MQKHSLRIKDLFAFKLALYHVTERLVNCFESKKRSKYSILPKGISENIVEKMKREKNQVVVFNSASHLVPVNGIVGSRFAGVFAAPGLTGEPPAVVPQTVAKLEL